MLSYYPRYFLIQIIKLYQKTLSFDHGVFKYLFPYGFCRFRPTCSNYAIGVIQKYGVVRGGAKALWRIMRCNPWNPGGNDPIN